MSNSNIERDPDIVFGTLTPEGMTNVRVIPASAIAKCPFVIFVPEHYREDNTCKCDDPTEQKRMIDEWGYTQEDFNLDMANDQMIDASEGLYDMEHGDG